MSFSFETTDIVRETQLSILSDFGRHVCFFFFFLFCVTGNRLVVLKTNQSVGREAFCRIWICVYTFDNFSIFLMWLIKPHESYNNILLRSLIGYHIPTIKTAHHASLRHLRNRIGSSGILAFLRLGALHRGHWAQPASMTSPLGAHSSRHRNRKMLAGFLKAVISPHHLLVPFADQAHPSHSRNRLPKQRILVVFQDRHHQPWRHQSHPRHKTKSTKSTSARSRQSPSGVPSQLTSLTPRFRSCKRLGQSTSLPPPPTPRQWLLLVGAVV